jgi:Rod binding domain-containing protein
MPLSIPTSRVAVEADTLAAARPSQPAQKLKKAAQEFESMLLSSWLQKMNESFAGNDEKQDPAHDTFTSLGTEAMAQALAARGGVGIAAKLLKQLQKPIAAGAGRQVR